MVHAIRWLCPNWGPTSGEKHAVDLQWQSGDVALLDNYLVMHARRIWNGPLGSRKLLASLVE